MLSKLYEGLCQACPQRENADDPQPPRVDGQYAYPPGSLKPGGAFTLGASFLLAPYALPTTARMACKTHGLEAVLGTLTLGIGMLGAFSMTPEFHDVMNLAVRTNLVSLGVELGRMAHAAWHAYRKEKEEG